MTEPSEAVLRGDRGDGIRDSRAKLVEIGGDNLADEVLDFGPAIFDRVKLWGVRREKENLSSSFFDETESFVILVDDEIIEHDDMITLEIRNKEFSDKNAKSRFIKPALKEHLGEHSSNGESTDERVMLPLLHAGWLEQSLASRSPAIEKRHIQIKPCLIYENQLVCGNSAHCFSIVSEFFPDLRSLTFTGV